MFGESSVSNQILVSSSRCQVKNVKKEKKIELPCVARTACKTDVLAHLIIDKPYGGNIAQV